MITNVSNQYCWLLAIVSRFIFATGGHAQMSTYEKLGAFYLGKVFDPVTQTLQPDMVLYDAKDLTTHAVIIGMTGSGKTGLGIGLLEEALIDRIPVIAIDPKGDIANLALTFPRLTSEAFKPWANPHAATARGLTLDAFAADEAKAWEQGLQRWDQDAERIGRLKAAADVTVYTPGSSAGRRISVLRNFAPPPPDMLGDPDLLNERIDTTTSGLMALLGLAADPITSREHILIANIFRSAWTQGQSLDMAGLIQSIQKPAFDRIGIMGLDTFYPPKDRFELAMRFNNLLAAPGFESWLEGDALDVGRLLYATSGRPRASIFTISHLTDAQRMFFVALLLGEIIGWMRTQPGTTSLRALLYMDEIFGYFPPVSNPPSKGPLLTLLKQARAFGLGVVLSTQNPVDLDYRGLSNAGTWFVGRLQTGQDKDRLMSGLTGTSLAAAVSAGRLEALISSLGKRTFLMHNVHENAPVVFQTRWALSYLAGPLTRDQIKRLAPDADHFSGDAAAASAVVSPLSSAPDTGRIPPSIPPSIQSVFLRGSGAGQVLVYRPALLGVVDVYYVHDRHQVNVSQTLALAVDFPEGAIPVDWEQATALKDTQRLLDNDPLPSASYADLPDQALLAPNYKKWERELLHWVKSNHALTLLQSKRMKMISAPDETEGAFRGRLSVIMHEKRDLAVEKLRKKYAGRFTTLQNRILSAEQAVSREEEQAKGRKMDTMISFGTAILGAFLGRKAVSAGSASRMGTAFKSAGRLHKEKMDVERAREKMAAIQAQMSRLEEQLQADIDRLEMQFDPEAEELVKIRIAPKPSLLNSKFLGLAWLPYRKDDSGRLVPDWV